LHIATNFEFFVTFSKSIFWKLYTPNILENNYKTRVMDELCPAIRTVIFQTRQLAESE